MNDSILNEIRMLRRYGEVRINRKNSNRYRVLLREENLSNTAYYFSTPIYGAESRRLVDLRFRNTGNSFRMEGSNAKISVQGNEISLQNWEGRLTVSFGGQQYFLHDRNLVSENVEIYPTLNGIAVKVRRNGTEDYQMHLSFDRPFMNIRDNPKCFAVMSEEFRPFMTVSAIGMTNLYGRLCSPAKITYQKLDDRNYLVNISAIASMNGSLLFELNLYEPKLFQDTTVESKNAGENNAFGGVAFIGDSETFGEQWLYSRLDTSKMLEIMNREVQKVILHLPRYNDSEVVLAGFEAAQRFCSFGSTWENKIELSRNISESMFLQNYQSMDLTDLLINKGSHTFQTSEGLILRSKVKGGGFSVIATGDNYYTPQILEINFK